MLIIPLYFSLGALFSLLPLSVMCFFSARRFRSEKQRHINTIEQQAGRAAAAADAGVAPAPGRRRQRPSGPAAAVLPPSGGDPLRTPLLQSIQEEEADAEPGAPLPVQTLDELPACVNAFLGRSVRDGRQFKLFSIQQIGRIKTDPRGGWKEATALQRACPLEPAFVWSASASLAPLVSLQGFDAFVEGRGRCCWYLWGAVHAASGGGREVEQSLLVRWLAEAVCFPQALQPSTFLRWETVRGEDNEAVAVLSYGGVTVRATFTFDRYARVVRMSSTDFLRRLPNGSFEEGRWTVSYSGHMLFGLSPQGEVMQEEMATHAGVFIPTNMEAAWQQGRDGSDRWVYAQFTVAKVTAE